MKVMSRKQFPATQISGTYFQCRFDPYVSIDQEESEIERFHSLPSQK